MLISNQYLSFIALLQIETENALGRSENMHVSTELQYVMGRCGADQKAI